MMRDSILEDGLLGRYTLPSLMFFHYWLNLLQFDGVGTLHFYGNSYTGDWVGGLKQGNGKLTYANGDIYEGQWEEDVPRMCH